jgi:hypothetical protein
MQSWVGDQWLSIKAAPGADAQQPITGTAEHWHRQAYVVQTGLGSMPFQYPAPYPACWVRLTNAAPPAAILLQAESKTTGRQMGCRRRKGAPQLAQLAGKTPPAACVWAGLQLLAAKQRWMMLSA